MAKPTTARARLRKLAVMLVAFAGIAVAVPGWPRRATAPDPS